MKPIVFLPDAEQEMAESAKYYEFHAQGLGFDFLTEVECAVQSIAESPETWTVVEKNLRRRLVRRFPFGIFYHIEPDANDIKEMPSFLSERNLGGSLTYDALILFTVKKSGAKTLLTFNERDFSRFKNEDIRIQCP